MNKKLLLLTATSLLNNGIFAAPSVCPDVRICSKYPAFDCSTTEYKTNKERLKLLQGAEGWKANFATILSNATGMADALGRDQSEYVEVKNKTEEMSNKVNQTLDAQRDTFKCLEKQYNNLKDNLASCQADTQQMKDVYKKSISDLRDKLAALEECTQYNIAQLTAEKNCLQGDLSDIQALANELLGEETKEASDLTTLLNDIKAQYDSTVAEQNKLIEKINTLISDITTLDTSDNKEIAAIRLNICDDFDTHEHDYDHVNDGDEKDGHKATDREKEYDKA